MQKPELIEKYFNEAIQRMRLQFTGWEKDIPHSGEKGGLRERRVATFLRDLLPQKYGIGSGHIIDSEGNTSRQADIVIFDAIDGIRIPIDEEYSLFPCESVYAVVEVKSSLTASLGAEPSGTINECIQGATDFKKLRRRINGNYEMGQYFVFSYSSTWNEDHEQVMKWFVKLSEERNVVIPDVVLVLDGEYVLSNCQTIDLSRYSHVYKHVPLAVFLSEIINRLSQINVEAPNLWTTYIQSQVGDVITKIYRDDGSSYEVKTLGFKNIRI